MTGGACATQGFGRLAVRPAQACAETSSRGIVPERSGSTHQVCGQFRDAVAECVATTRRRCPQGAIFSGPPEKTHPPARETPGPHLAPRSPSQWLPHGSMDDEASRGSDRKDLPRALPLQYRWQTPPSARLDTTKTREARFRPKFQRVPNGILLIRRGIAQISICGYWERPQQFESPSLQRCGLRYLREGQI